MKTYVRFGIYFAAMQTIYIVCEYLLGLHTTYIDQMGYGQLIFIFLAIGMMSWGLIYRKRELGGRLPYLDGVLMGWIVGVVSGAIACVFFYFYLDYINPGFLERAIESTVRTGTYTQEEAEQMFTVPAYYYGMFIFSQLAGAGTNAVMGLLLKTSWGRN